MQITKVETKRDGRYYECFSCDECGEQTGKFYYEIKGEHTVNRDEEYNISICSKCYRRLLMLIKGAMDNIKMVPVQ